MNNVIIPLHDLQRILKEVNRQGLRGEHVSRVLYMPPHTATQADGGYCVSLHKPESGADNHDAQPITFQVEG
jgi:hypothetical protein